MITIQNGKLTIPENMRFIGFAGDNLRRTIEFLLLGATESDRIYRLYLTFDDGTVNFFTLPHTLTSQGVLLTWNVLEEHIFKSGIVRAQLKAFSQNNVIWHSTPDIFVVGDSAEFSDSLAKPNSEFLDCERRLNSLKEYIETTSFMLVPFIGENGNWYIYDNEAGEYIDSGKPSVGETQTQDIADGAVTGNKIASNTITADKLSETYWRYTAAIPVTSYSALDTLISQSRNTITDIEFSGLSGIVSTVGSGEFLGVVDQTNSTLLLINKSNGEMWTYVKESNEINAVDLVDKKLKLIGTFNTINAVLDYPFEENKLYHFYTSGGMSDLVDHGKCIGTASNLSTQPRLNFLNYATGVCWEINLTTGECIRKSESIVTDAEDISIEDTNGYYAGTDVESALQEIGATLDGLEELLESI